jgi:hypothetical protein
MKDKLFEEWAKTHNYKTKIEEGFYTNTHTQSAWEAWKASAPRELSDEEINQLWAESHEDGIAIKQEFTTQQHYFAHLILKKASEK